MSSAFTVTLNEDGRFEPVLNPSHRAEAVVANQADLSTNTYRDFSVLAFGGENEISLISSHMQNGMVDVVMLHARVDSSVEVYHQTFHARPFRSDQLSTDAMLGHINAQIAEWLN